MKVNSKTSVFAVLGDPVSHSMSPAMHNAAFAQLNYNGVYVAMRVRDIGAAVSGVKALGIQGASITIPHKVSVMPFLDEIDEVAQKIGAVNTIATRDGKLIGYNTDCLGATRALLEKVSLRKKRVVVLGAGGAARAVGFGIISEGGSVTVVNRSAESGEKLAADLGSEFEPYSKLKELTFDVLINTTPVGMTPRVDASPIDGRILKEGQVVMDAVYNPLKTRLLQAAEAAGCSIVDGLTMFVYQGALQLELWTGRKAPMDVMRNAVLNLLEWNEAFAKRPRK